MSLDFSVKNLGRRRVINPLKSRHFVDDERKLIYQPELSNVEKYIKKKLSIPAMEIAGPREKIYFNPKETIAGIVTCGGLCPGLNDVIRSIVNTLHYIYKVKKILGFRYGYKGLTFNYYEPPIELTPKLVEDIHEKGGTILGTSRGSQDETEIVDMLVKRKISILFCIGGDGTLRGAHKIHLEIEKRNLDISVIGIPKTIDNDILFLERTFGFETAVDEARRVVTGAHNEAKGAYNGIGLIKVMGRESGFIAAYTALAANDVNFVLIPEVEFELEGENGFLKHLENRLLRRHHAVIVVAEGAGQNFFKGDFEKDKSGNLKFKDIGLYLKQRITEYFKEKDIPFTIKYIDPSYTIRSLPANANDSLYCLRLGQHAVHAGMAGKTDLFVGKEGEYFVHIPLGISVSGRKKIDPAGSFWASVLYATGQSEFKNR